MADVALLPVLQVQQQQQPVPPPQPAQQVNLHMN